MNEFYVHWVVNENTDEMVPYFVTEAWPNPSKDGVLAVPYHSQWEADARKFASDCGPACVEMIGEFYRTEDHTTDEIMTWITRVNDYTSATDLVNAARHFYNVTLVKDYVCSWDELKVEIEAKRPVIVLVHYGSFIMRLDRNYTKGHWMVVAGFDEVDYQGTLVERIILHDPDWWGNYTMQGAFLPVTRYQFEQMWGNCHLDGGNPDYFALKSKV